jgi:hypothetical protein
MRRALSLLLLTVVPVLTGCATSSPPKLVRTITAGPGPCTCPMEEVFLSCVSSRNSAEIILHNSGPQDYEVRLSGVPEGMGSAVVLARTTLNLLHLTSPDCSHSLEILDCTPIVD